MPSGEPYALQRASLGDYDKLDAAPTPPELPIPDSMRRAIMNLLVMCISLDTNFSLSWKLHLKSPHEVAQMPERKLKLTKGDPTLLILTDGIREAKREVPKALAPLIKNILKNRILHQCLCMPAMWEPTRSFEVDAIARLHILDLLNTTKETNNV